MGALALEYGILSASRSGEVTGATWREIDLAQKLWTIPGERMKGGKEHRVPLGARAVEILKKMAAYREDDETFVFHASSSRTPLSDMTLNAVIRRMNADNEATGRPKWIDPKQGRAVVPHGFRSTFRDWAGDLTNFPSDLVEFALAHALDDETEAAYRRSDMLERRRRLMNAWSEFVSKAPSKGAEVVAIRG